MCIAFIGCDFWFQTGAHRTKFKIQLRRSDSDDSIWFVALAIEQLALVTDDGSHRFPFVMGLRLSVRTRPKWRKASVMLLPRCVPILFSRQVQPACICLPSRNGQGGRTCTCVLLLPRRVAACKRPSAA